MRTTAIALLVGVGALLASSAYANDMRVTQGSYLGTDEPLVENVRLVCNEDGRCYRTRAGRRIIIGRDSYNYAPPQRRGYRGYDNPRNPAFQEPHVTIGNE